MRILGSNILIWFPSVLLVAGLINDLLYRKYHNLHFIAALIITIGVVSSFLGASQLMTGGIAALCAFVVGTALVVGGVIGAGDMKLMVVFGFATDYQTVLFVYLGSLVWGSIMGLSQALMSGQAGSILTNLKLLFLLKLKPKKEDLHKIPFTAPLLLSWISLLIIRHNSLIAGGAS